MFTLNFDVEISSVNMASCPWTVDKNTMFWWLLSCSWCHNADARDHTLWCIRCLAMKAIWQSTSVVWYTWSKTICLTHWGRVTHIYVGNLAIIVSDNGLSPGRCQAIIWTNVGILLIGPLGTNFSEMLIKIHTFSFKKIHLKMSSGKWRPFCLGLNSYQQFVTRGLKKLGK